MNILLPQHEIARLRSLITSISAALEDDALSDFAKLVAIGALVDSLEPLTDRDIARGRELWAALGMPDE